MTPLELLSDQNNNIALRNVKKSSKQLLREFEFERNERIHVAYDRLSGLRFALIGFFGRFCSDQVGWASVIDCVQRAVPFPACWFIFVSN